MSVIKKPLWLGQLLKFVNILSIIHSELVSIRVSLIIVGIKFKVFKVSIKYFILFCKSKFLILI